MRVVLALTERRGWMRELEDQLRAEAYRVHVVASGTEMVGPLMPDLILLDLARPEQDAAATLAPFADPRPPDGIRSAAVVFLTPDCTDRVVVEALEAGADYCLPASISSRELAAWVRALMRRRATHVSARTTPFTLGSVTVDLTRGRVEKRGAPVLLPPTQLLLLRALAERSGLVVSHEHLLAQVLGDHPPRKMGTLHVHMFQLRTTIEDDPRHPRYLKTVRGVGYVLNEEPGSSRASPDTPAEAGPSTLSITLTSS